MPNLSGGHKFSFPTLFDFYREVFLKHSHFSIDLRNQATVEKQRNREQGLQLGRVATIWRVKISLCFLT